MEQIAAKIHPGAGGNNNSNMGGGGGGGIGGGGGGLGSKRSIDSDGSGKLGQTKQYELQSF